MARGTGTRRRLDESGPTRSARAPYGSALAGRVGSQPTALGWPWRRRGACVRCSVGSRVRARDLAESKRWRAPPCDGRDDRRKLTLHRGSPMRALTAVAPHPQLVSLLDVDDSFARDIPMSERALARRALMLPVTTLDRGPWPGPAATGAGTTTPW